MVGIGASAGGYEAFVHLLQHLGTKTNMAYVFVQHLDPSRKSQLVELVSRCTEMPVREIAQGTTLEPNHVYVLPPNHNLAILHGAFNLMPRSQSVPALPVDYFFRSLAEDRGNKSVGVVLSGTASDGTAGLKAIKAAGGVTFAQDDKTAKFDGMPRSAIAAGCVDFVLSPSEIAWELVRIGTHPYVRAPAGSDHALVATNDQLNKVFVLLRSATGADFTYYKDTTVRRRIGRRMVLHKIEQIDHYLKYLHGHAEEVKALFHDILINVTSFFREPETFDLLQKKVLPLVMKNRRRDEAIRIWAAGCSTGEETYSLAIALTEFLHEKATTIPIQIFGTDLSDWGMDKARAGIYPESIAQDLSAERLRRFFVKCDGGFQVTKQIRDLCVFARHDLTRDPPFSRMDLILCRNVLIYLGSILQKKIMKVFHYALKPSGWLMLGSSETIGGAADLFSLKDRKYKLYSRKSGTAAASFNLTPAEHPRPETSPARRPTGNSAGERLAFDAMREADQLVMSRFTPPGVLVNENLDILQFRGETEKFLKPAPGQASLNVLKMAREGLVVELRSALYKAIKEHAPVTRSRLRVRYDNSFHALTLEVLPVKTKVDDEHCFLVLFHYAGPLRSDSVAPLKRREKAGRANEKDDEIQRLRQELKSTNEYLQSVIEEQEATNEEIRSANEEIQSSNEELQSTNEELETAKEELQSTNEELTTVNEELENRNVELSDVNNDLSNLLNNVNIPVVILGDDMLIRRFTPQSEAAMNLIATDIGRPLTDIKLNIDIPDLESLVRRVVSSLTAEEREVQDHAGRWYLLRIRPYRTMENKIDGAVMALVDIDALKQGLQQIKDSRVSMRSLGQLIREPLLVLDRNLRVQIANQPFAQLSFTPVEEVEGKLLYELGDGHWNLEHLRVLMDDLLSKSHQLVDFEIKAVFPKVGIRVLSLDARRISDNQNETQSILLVFKEKKK